MQERAAHQTPRWLQGFGDVLPDSTTDDLDEPSPLEDLDTHDRWLRDNRPPHHDGPV